MFAGVEMFSGMLVLGGIAAAQRGRIRGRVASEPSCRPIFRHILAALAMRMNILNVADVRADGAHASSFLRRLRIVLRCGGV